MWYLNFQGFSCFSSITLQFVRLKTFQDLKLGNIKLKKKQNLKPNRFYSNVDTIECSNTGNFLVDVIFQCACLLHSHFAA